MVSKRINATNIRWIAARSYRVKRDTEARARSILVALTAPRKLRKDEYPIRTDLPLYGCTVQTGAERTRHMVYGRDAMEALSHSLLAIDRFLSLLVETGEVHSPDGGLFEQKVHGQFTGSIGEEYRKR